MEDSALITSMCRAVEAAPEDVALRVHLASLLIDAARRDDAVPHLSLALAADPESSEIRQLMARALGGPAYDWKAAE